METATKCMMCNISLECSLTRNMREICQRPYKKSYDHTDSLKSNLRSRLRGYLHEKRVRLTA